MWSRQQTFNRSLVHHNKSKLARQIPQASVSRIPDLFWVTWSILVPTSHLDTRLHCKLLREKARHLAVVKGKTACCCLKGLLLLRFISMVLQQACRPDSCLASGKRVSVFLARLSVSLSNVPFTERGKIRASVTIHSGFHGVTRVQWQTLPMTLGLRLTCPLACDDWLCCCVGFVVLCYFKVTVGQSHFSEVTRKRTGKWAWEERHINSWFFLFFWSLYQYCFLLNWSQSSWG